MFTLKTTNSAAENYVENEFQDVFLIEKSLKLSSLKLEKTEVSEVKLIDFKQLEMDIEEGRETFCPHPEEYARLFEYLRQTKKVIRGFRLGLSSSKRFR